MGKNIVKEKSFSFALSVINLAKYLESERKEYVLSRQFLRSGTAIGALIREAEHAQSKADFISKMNIALKEANETQYWIELLHESNYISTDRFESMNPKVEELLKLLISIVKTSRSR